MTLPPATVSSVPIYDFAMANEELQGKAMEAYYPCCGKTFCKGCAYSNIKSGSKIKCPFCNSDHSNKTREERVEEMMKRVEANDAASICMLADSYYQGLNGFQQDQKKAMELYARAAELGCSKAHNELGVIYHERGDMKKAKFHVEAAAMAGNEAARYNLGAIEYHSGNIERAVKHWTIAASAGHYNAMHNLRVSFENGDVSRESIDSSLTAYNSSCAEMRSEARDASI
jgi:TPR repeat protein